MKLFLKRYSILAALFFICVCFFSNCSLYDNIFYGRTKYNKLEASQKQQIVLLNSFNTIDNSKVYKITGNQLKEELKRHQKVVVERIDYCSIKSGLLKNIEKIYLEQGYKYYFILVDCALIKYIDLEERESPIFAIDFEYYNTSYINQHTNYFLNDLLGRDKNAKFYKNYKPYYLFFEYGKLVEPTMIEDDKDYAESYRRLLTK